MAKVQKSGMTKTVGGKVVREPREQDRSDRGRFFWWKRKDDWVALGHEIMSTIKFIQRHQGQRIEQLTVSSRMYGNTSAANLLGTAFTRANSVNTNPASQRISFNVCSSVIDTLVSQHAKSKVVPTFLTQGGIWGMQKKAEQLSKFADGFVYEQKVHEKKIYAFRDACVWGDGIVHVFRDDKDRACVERTLPHELIVDMVETLAGPAKQLHRIKIVDRNVLADMYKDDEDALSDILEAMPTAPQDLGASQTAADLITVAESWHLKSGPDATDGLRVITLVDQGKVLTCEDYDKDYFPFASIQYTGMKRLLGYWGQGACERLQNLQGELNRLMILDQKSRWMQASFKILVENGSKVVSQHLNNDIGAIIHYTGTPPQYIVPPIIDASNETKIQQLKQDAYQQEGVSMMNAASVKPIGVNSGAAMRTYDEIAEDRQLFMSQQIEEFELEIIRQAIEIVRDVYKDKGEYEVKYPSANFIETIDWGDIDLDRDSYYLKAFPTSELPDEPAARIQTVTEYTEAGWLSPRGARRLMRTQDLEMSDHLASASEELIMKSIEAILYEGKKASDFTPDGEWDLGLLQQLALQYINFAKLHDCPEKRLQQLRDFISYAQDQAGLTQVQPNPIAPQGQAQPPGGAAPANPMPTPQSTLLPNVNGGAA